MLAHSLRLNTAHARLPTRCSQEHDPNIAYPHTPNALQRVPVPLLFRLCFTLPLAVMVLLLALLPTKLPKRILVNEAVLGLISSLSFTLLVICIIKNSVGRLRPDFLDRRHSPIAPGAASPVLSDSPDPSDPCRRLARPSFWSTIPHPRPGARWSMGYAPAPPPPLQRVGSPSLPVTRRSRTRVSGCEALLGRRPRPRNKYPCRHASAPPYLGRPWLPGSLPRGACLPRTPLLAARGDVEDPSRCRPLVWRAAGRLISDRRLLVSGVPTMLLCSASRRHAAAPAPLHGELSLPLVIKAHQGSSRLIKAHQGSASR